MATLIKMKNSIDRINTVESFGALIQQAPLVVVTSYRGRWCPFCLRYLCAFNKAYKKMPENSLLVGISVDSNDECEKLKQKLKLDFDLISDETLTMRELFSVTTGKGHGKAAYLQPSVLIL